jgi:hypothetical protein
MDDGLTPARSAEPNRLATAPSLGEAASHRRQRGVALTIPSAWPLAPVLIVQAILSIRLVRADTAFLDEASYLWAGHLEWAHWLHNQPIPQFPAYFSGAPVIYPPLAAVADSLGGLTAARLLSLIFMLGATALLWSAARRLFGRQAAFFAAALFAILGPTLHLGAFATYDAMSVFLIGLAAWLVIRAGARPQATGLLILTGVVLALANATAYSSTLFDVIVILAAFLMAVPELGARTAATRCLTVLIVAVVLLGAGLLIGGSTYWHGVRETTFQRAAGRASVLTVLGHTWLWTGVVIAAALCGVVISWVRREGRWNVLLLAVLTVGALIGPLEQANLRTATSLDKHVGLGAWFAAIAAGYAVDRLIAAAPAGQSRTITCGACVVALALPMSLGLTQSRTFSTDWPNSTSFIAILRPLADHGNGHLLVEDPEIAEYYLHAESQWKQWSSTRNIVLPSGASSGGPTNTAGVVGPGNAGTYGTKILHDYFSLVALNFADTTLLDKKIAADLRANHSYRIIEVVPYGMPNGTYVIWQLEPSP